jgi:hypothetical protein
MSTTHMHCPSAMQILLWLWQQNACTPHTQVHSHTALLHGTSFCQHSTISAGSKLYCSCIITSVTLSRGGEREKCTYSSTHVHCRSPTLHNRNEGKTWDRFLYGAFWQHSLIIKSPQHTQTHRLTNARFTTQLVQYVLAFLTSVTELLDIYGQLHYLAGRTHILSQHSSFQRMTQECPTYLSECVCRWQFGLTAVPLTARHTPTGNININPSMGYLNFMVVYGKHCEYKTYKTMK